MEKRSNLEIVTVLQNIFRETLDDEFIELQPEMTSNDLEDWDSLRHAMIVSKVQKQFDLNLSLTELIHIESIQDFIDIIRSKTN